VLDAVILDFGHTIVDFALNERALLATYEEVQVLLVEYAVGELPTASDLVKSVSMRLSSKINESYLRQELQELDVLAEFASLFADINLQLPPDLIRRIVELEHRALTAELHVSPANLAALCTLRADGFQLGLVSNITFYGEFVRCDLDRLGLLDLFQAVVLSSEVGVRKPHPRIYEAALGGLHVSAERALFVGDRLREDVGGPQAVGMRSALTREFRVEEIEPGSPVPDAVIDRLSELPVLARNLRAAGV
jgi:FMN phosphatase YigB (HAD superfamily)